MAMKNTIPTSHYLIYVARKDHLAAKRDGYVRIIAALDRGGPLHARSEQCRRRRPDRHHHRPRRRDLQEGAEAIPRHRLLGDEDDGMDRNKIEAVAALMKKIGTIKPGKEPADL